MTKYKFTEDLIYSQFFSFEVLDYFDSIVTDKNFEWIEKYFNVLMKNENNSAEKFNMHHIRPCCTFKDENHKNRKQTLPLANKFNGNIIKLSIYNHFFAHFYLWKIFNTQDTKKSFQQMCGEEKYIDNLTENELKSVARLKEECAKKNQTDEDKKEKILLYRKSEKGKENQRKRSLKYYYNNKENVSKRKKKYGKNNKNKISQYNSEYYKNNKDKIYEHKKEYRRKNKNKVSQYNSEYYVKNRKKALNVNKEYLHQQCYDPIKEDYCTLGALRGRIYRNKKLYKNINLKDCIMP